MGRKKVNIISPYRFEAGFHLLVNWLGLRQQEKGLAAYFEDNDIHAIAIYGLGAIGELLLQEMKNTGIEVIYAIDRIASEKHLNGLRIYGTDEEQYPLADAIVVTPIQDYDQIAQSLWKKTDLPVLSLQDIVDYCIR